MAVAFTLFLALVAARIEAEVLFKESFDNASAPLRNVASSAGGHVRRGADTPSDAGELHIPAHPFVVTAVRALPTVIGLQSIFPGASSPACLLLSFEHSLGAAPPAAACSGGYVTAFEKLLPANATTSALRFLVFGPDCEDGSVRLEFHAEHAASATRRVHALRAPPRSASLTDGRAHMYSLLLNLTTAFFEISIDGTKVRSGLLARELSPPLLPTPREADAAAVYDFLFARATVSAVGWEAARVDQTFDELHLQAGSCAEVALAHQTLFETAMGPEGAAAQGNGAQAAGSSGKVNGTLPPRASKPQADSFPSDAPAPVLVEPTPVRDWLIVFPLFLGYTLLCYLPFMDDLRYGYLTVSSPMPLVLHLTGLLLFGCLLHLGWICSAAAPAGHYCAAEHSLLLPLPCPRGRYCPTLLGSPVLCPAGTFSERTGLTKSATLAAGRFARA
jgi:hypothetical protein